MIGLIIYLLVIGVIAGYLARLLVPGPDPMGFWQTAALGIVGSFVGGVLGYVIFNHDLDEGALQASGVIGSIIGAVIRAADLPRDHTARRWRPGGQPVSADFLAVRPPIG